MISDRRLLPRTWVEREPSPCVQGDTVRRLETVWIGNDICQEGLSVRQSEVMRERRDRIGISREKDGGEGGEKESGGWLTVSWNYGMCNNHMIFCMRLLAHEQGLIHVLRIGVTHVRHDSAPVSPALSVCAEAAPSLEQHCHSVARSPRTVDTQHIAKLASVHSHGS